MATAGATKKETATKAQAAGIGGGVGVGLVAAVNTALHLGLSGDEVLAWSLLTTPVCAFIAAYIAPRNKPK